MTDVVASEVRSRMMAGIRSKNTTPELAIRKLLTSAGWRYRLHRGDLPGSPDIVMPGRRIAIFVHGCFWHGHKGCHYFKQPASNNHFWQKKLGGNAERDRQAINRLVEAGWRVLVVWECATRQIGEGELGDLLGRWISGQERSTEIPARVEHETHAVTADL